MRKLNRRQRTIKRAKTARKRNARQWRSARLGPPLLIVDFPVEPVSEFRFEIVYGSREVSGD